MKVDYVWVDADLVTLEDGLAHQCGGRGFELRCQVEEQVLAIPKGLFWEHYSVPQNQRNTVIHVHKQWMNTEHKVLLEVAIHSFLQQKYKDSLQNMQVISDIGEVLRWMKSFPLYRITKFFQLFFVAARQRELHTSCQIFFKRNMSTQTRKITISCFPPWLS